jgi:hypothetical protein
VAGPLLDQYAGLDPACGRSAERRRDEPLEESCCDRLFERRTRQQGSLERVGLLADLGGERTQVFFGELTGTELASSRTTITTGPPAAGPRARDVAVPHPADVIMLTTNTAITTALSRWPWARSFSEYV